jgi:hypothetical protein
VRDARNALICLIEASGTTTSTTDMAFDCRSSGTGVALRTTPIGSIKASSDQLAKAIKLFADLQAPSPSLTDKLNKVAVNQALLEESLKSVQAAQAVLLQAAGVLERIEMRTLEASDEKTFSSSARDVDRTATIKVSAQDLVSKSSTNLVTITVVWGSTHWEMSAGVLFSALTNRSFQNAPIIINGKPITDANGKVNMVLTETSTRPTVVPIAFGHYRLVEGTLSGRRLALLLSGGIGVNPYSSTADFGTGLTFSYRNSMITPLLHFGRDLRLTNGLTVGAQLGPSPPPPTTERYWVHKFGIAISYRLPIP